ncbi:Ger(x)C family spore germination protein [Bacillus sp. B15-48]|uniref:Ger(x)C family spore germination protein n=1 Tax=Bacillus sp. B15-48 TaxID=1548601 RepID=UPI00193F5069|nr:Ger(x)C family spore germination protein [Bacillus sp. B15-48]
MKKGRKSHIFFLLLVCVVVLIGCARTKIIDKISIIHAFGFDQADNDEIIGTALFPDYTKSKAADQIHFLEEQAATASLVVSKMAAHTSTPIEIPKIGVLLFGNGYAEAGVSDMVKRLVMTPQLGTNIQIAASTHSAKETLNTFKNEKSLTLAERLEHNMQGQHLPIMNLHVFLNHFYGEGMDAYVPMLTIDAKDQISIEGLGIFKGDKLKLHLNPEQSTIFSIIKDKRTRTTYKIELDNEKNRGEILIVRTEKTKSHWDWDQEKQQLNLRVKLKMALTQYPDRFDVENPDDVREITKIVVGNLEKGMKDLLATFKENEVDPIGIGNIVRSKDITWDVESFYKQYPTLPIHVNVDLEIIHSGLEG